MSFKSHANMCSALNWTVIKWPNLEWNIKSVKNSSDNVTKKRRLFKLWPSRTVEYFDPHEIVLVLKVTRINACSIKTGLLC